MALTKIKLDTMVTGNLSDANIPDNITISNAGTATALETARTIHGVSFDGTANIDLTEAIQDVVGGMVSSNTETNIAVTYDDTNGKLDFASTDTTYSVGDGGLTQNNFTDALKTKLDGIASSANNYSLPLATSSARGGVKIGYSENGKNYPVELDSEKMYVNVPWTDTNTTYSVGDGGLTQNNFTNALKSKLDGIEAGATADQDLSGYATLSGASFTGDVVISDYESKLTLTKTRNTTQSFHIAHENDDGCLDFLRESTRTARITNNGRWVIGGHTEVNSSQLSVQGNLGVTGLAYFKYGSSSNDNVRFYNQDGSYSYIRVTADGNNANTWFDTKLGSTTWFGWTNTGGSGVSSWHFGTGGSTSNNSVKISSGSILQYNSSGNNSTTLNADGSATFGGVVTYSTSSGTIMSRGGFSDFIGYNSTYGTYIGGGASNASRYIYAGGYFYDGSGVRTLYHTGNLNPITTSNIGSQSVSYASNSGTLSGHDTRSVTTTPQTINAGVKFDFKNNSSNGLSDGGSYHGLMTYRQYGGGGDWSGGHAHQIGFTDNTRLYHRSGTGTSWNTSWYKIHTQRDMPNSGYNGADVTLRTNSNGYLDISNWINVTSHGIYSSNINGFHFMPNQVSDYGVARLIGTRSGYSGINYNNKTTLMMADDTIGLYNDENNEWICYGNRNGNFYQFYNGTTRTATYTNGLYVYGNGSGEAHIAEGNSRTLVLQTSSNNSEFHVGENSYTYGNMSLRGSSNSYQGIIMPIHNNYPTMMFNTSSNGGFYYQSGRWAFYHNYSHNCAGINTSGTSSSYRLYVNGSAYSTGSWSSSDARLKTDVTTIENSLDKVMNMRGVYFNWIPEDRDKARQTGVIAQEVLEVLPECVNHDEENDEYSVDYNKITAVLIESIKDLKNEINELKKGCCNGS